MFYKRYEHSSAPIVIVSAVLKQIPDPSLHSCQSLTPSGHRQCSLAFITERLRVANIDNSETPFVPSKHSKAGSYRVVTAARFQSSTDPTIKFSVLNTHFDDQSDDQRRLGGSMLRYRAHYEVKETNSKAVIVVGDFNRLEFIAPLSLLCICAQYLLI